MRWDSLSSPATVGQGNETRLDANESAFFLRQIEYIKAKTYDVKYKELKAFDLIPISNEAPSGTPQITWRQYVGVGFAKIIADYANDFPRVDTYGNETTTLVRGIGASYGYSIVEIRRAAIANVPLDQKKANFARRAIEQVINSIAWSGLTPYSINGLVNYPGITAATIPADGTGTSTLWTTKTPDQIIRDLNNLITAVVATTRGREMPTTLLLPIENYLYISNTRMGLPSDKTILSYFLDAQRDAGSIRKVDWLPDELKNVGVSGNIPSGGTASSRMLAYVQDEDHLTLEIPQPFEQFPSDQEGMEFEIACHAETAGVLVYYPLSIAYGDGI